MCWLWTHCGRKATTQCVPLSWYIIFGRNVRIYCVVNVQWRLSLGSIYSLLIIVIIITCLFDNVAQEFECENCTPWGVRICKLTVSVMKPSPINGYRTFGVCNPFGSWNETVQVVRSFCPWVTNLPLGKRVSNRQDKYDYLYAWSNLIKLLSLINLIVGV